MRRRGSSNAAALAVVLLAAGVAALGPQVPSAEAAAPHCAPVQISSPSRLHVKVYVGGCYWDDVALGDSMNIRITLTGPGYSKVLASYRYGLFPGGPMAAQAAYSKSGSIAVPRGGTYKVTVVESYDYIVVPERASSQRSTTVQGPAPTPRPTPRPTPKPTPRPTPRPTTAASPPAASPVPLPSTPPSASPSESALTSPSPTGSLVAPASAGPASAPVAAVSAPATGGPPAPVPSGEPAAAASWAPTAVLATVLVLVLVAVLGVRLARQRR